MPLRPTKLRCCRTSVEVVSDVRHCFDFLCGHLSNQATLGDGEVGDLQDDCLVVEQAFIDFNGNRRYNTRLSSQNLIDLADLFTVFSVQVHVFELVNGDIEFGDLHRIVLNLNPIRCARLPDCGSCHQNCGRECCKTLHLNLLGWKLNEECFAWFPGYHSPRTVSVVVSACRCPPSARTN